MPWLAEDKDEFLREYFKPDVVIFVSLLKEKIEIFWFGFDENVEFLLMKSRRELFVYIFIFTLSEKSLIIKIFAK